MRNLKLILAYDGSRYQGWQRLPGVENTIQGKLERTISRILEEPVEVSGSGRTDAGAPGGPGSRARTVLDRARACSGGRPGPVNAPLLLFVGGTRSGKSGLAQRWAEAQSPRRLFLATCRVEDAEMAARVARHQAVRGAGWHCVEEPLDPLAVLGGCPAGSAFGGAGVVLLDCVSLWIANLLAAGGGSGAGGGPGRRPG